jgi:hypothetical protein
MQSRKKSEAAGRGTRAAHAGKRSAVVSEEVNGCLIKGFDAILNLDCHYS